MTRQVRTIPWQFSSSNTLVKLLNSKQRIVVSRGGTRSGKTYAMLQILARWLITGELRRGEYVKEGVAGVVRKYATTLKSTVIRDFKEIIFDTQARMGVRFEIMENKTDKTFRFGKRQVDFVGADDEQKLRGYKTAILFCNEANELNYRKEFFQLMIRCTGPVFIDFNPSDPYVWIKEELEDKRALTKGDVQTIVSTYLDNPYLSDEQIEEIENLQYSDPALWAVYGKGEYGKVEGLVIPSITLIDEMPTDLRYPGGGLDFGFTNDPTSLCECGIRLVDRRHQLFIDERIYQTGLNEAALVKKFADEGISKALTIIADTSHPGSVNTLKRAGYNVHKTKKRPGSVRHRLSLMRSHEIFVTKRSLGFIREQKLHKFKMHSNGQYLNDAVDANNHSFDAASYYLLRFSKLNPFK